MQAPGKGEPETAHGTRSGGSPGASPAAERPEPTGDDKAEQEVPVAASTSPAASARPTGDGTAPTAGPGDGAGTSPKEYSVDGGRVTFDMKGDHAELVSATPNPGWRMQVWKHPQWIRVSFTAGDREIAVFCTWYQHPPLVEIEER
ncbi:hypothetical protein ACIRFH_08695 [Streptomyces sp. NPDC093586]|uniref:hypothetical protein n=1 Tax=Streptomyces sp. NPDC093586 TaxID=3366042 RepID=UPI00381330ED